MGEGKQMTSGSACFGIMLTKAAYAEEIGHILELFTVSSVGEEPVECVLTSYSQSLRRVSEELKVSSNRGSFQTLELTLA